MHQAALGSAISRTIIEQTPTKVFFPNADAGPDYIEGFGLSEREFRLIKEELEPGSRQFLVKHGHHSVACALDLKGFDAELAVISGRATTLALLDLLERLIAENGAAISGVRGAAYPEAESGLVCPLECLESQVASPSLQGRHDAARAGEGGELLRARQRRF